MVPGEYVLCEVSDTGTGIPPEIIDKIFEPFFSTKEVGKAPASACPRLRHRQADRRLYLCRERVGEGTVFRIYLPRSEEAVEAAEQPADKGQKKEVARDLTGSATVLLVETRTRAQFRRARADDPRL